jgi:hypothetical protein
LLEVTSYKIHTLVIWKKVGYRYFVAFSKYLNFTGSGCENNSGNSFEGRNICQAYCVTKAVQQSSTSRSLQAGVSNVESG